MKNKKRPMKKRIHRLMEKIKMKKRKNESSWSIDASGLTFDLHFCPIEIEKKTGFFIPEGRKIPEFAEYLTSVDMELKICSNIASELDESFEVRVISETMYMDTGDESDVYEVAERFDGTEEVVYLYMAAPKERKDERARIKVILSFGGSTIFEQAFEIELDGSVSECETFGGPLLLECAK